MSLVKSKGNMYSWCSHTWNPIKGRCQFDCTYCYVPNVRGGKFFKGEPWLDTEELKTHLGRAKIIFVGSMFDMWGFWVSKEDIQKILNRCRDFPGNQYVFQSKDPSRFKEFDFAGLNVLLGTTIETNRYPGGFKTKAPSIDFRVSAMTKLQGEKFVTIEPIMEFDLNALVEMIRKIQPKFVTLGADSKNHRLKEPAWKEVQILISELSKVTEIRQKSNLERLRK